MYRTLFITNGVLILFMNKKFLVPIQFKAH